MLITRKTKLTSNQEIPIITRPIPACLNIVNASPYAFASPAAVSIFQPAQRQMIKAISAKSPRTQLIAVFTAPIKPSAPLVAASPDFATPILLAELVVLVNVLLPSVGWSKAPPPCPPPCPFANAGSNANSHIQATRANCFMIFIMLCKNKLNKSDTSIMMPSRKCKFIYKIFW